MYVYIKMYVCMYTNVCEYKGNPRAFDKTK